MTPMSTLAPHVLDAIAATSRRVVSRYRHADIDDIYQDLCIAALTDSRDVNTMDNALLYLFLNGRGNRAARSYAPQSDTEHAYTRAQVEALLPYTFHGTDEFTDSEDSDNLRAMIADVASAYAILSPVDKKVLGLRYRDDLTLTKISKATDHAGHPGVIKALDSALDRLLARLRGDAPTWSRPAINRDAHTIARIA